MKAVLEFDLDNEDDEEAYASMLMARRLALALSEFATRIRSTYKHKDLTDEQDEIKEEIMGIFHKVLNENVIDITEL